MSEDDELAAARAPRRANITAIAEATHTSKGRAVTILKLARMRRASDGTFLYEKAVAEILASKDLARSVGHQVGGDDSALVGAVANVAAGVNSKVLFDAARTRKLTIEVEKMEGRLIERAVVIEMGLDIAAHVRINLAGIGAKIANDVVHAKDAATAQAFIDDAIHEALQKVADFDVFFLGDTT